MATIRDIAAACGLSVSTVSKALNQYSDVSEKTRRQVMEAAKQAGYFPNASARALKTNRTYNLGVLFSDDQQSGLTHRYFSAVLDSFKKEAEANGYDITFISHNIGERPMTYLEHCQYRGVDGVCIACVDFYQPEVLELVRSPLPLVTIDHIFDGHSCVCSENAEGIRELLCYVSGKGHTRIAFLHGEASSVANQRLVSFCRTMEALRLPVPDEYLIPSPYNDPDSARINIARLLDLPEPPTCVLLPDDYSALGAMEAIESRGLRIPYDISIIGFDGIELGQRIRPRLTTFRQDTEQIGSEAARRLIRKIESPRTEPAETVVIPGRLLKGETVDLPHTIR